MYKIRRYLREVIRDKELVLLSIIIAGCILATPLQHQITLSRFQHYSLGVCAIAVGFLLQTVISWRYVSWWGRGALFSCFLYMGAFAAICYFNPWLDWNFDLETSWQAEQRHQFAGMFAASGFLVGCIWSVWAIERRRNRFGGKLQDEQEPQETVSP